MLLDWTQLCDSISWLKKKERFYCFLLSMTNANTDWNNNAVLKELEDLVF